jgi:hypothetical protein
LGTCAYCWSGERASRPQKRPHRRSRRSTSWGIDTDYHGATLAPIHHAWLLLAAVADPAPSLIDTDIDKELTMRPTPIPLAIARPLFVDCSSPIEFLARPQLLTRR